MLAFGFSEVKVVLIRVQFDIKGIPVKERIRFTEPKIPSSSDVIALSRMQLYFNG